MITKIKIKKKVWKDIGDRLAPWSIKFVFVVVVGILLFSNLQMNQRRRQLILKIGELDQKITAIEKRNQELEAGIVQEVDEKYLEQEARDNFQMKKPGESVVVVSLPKNGIDDSFQIEKTWWQKILEWVGIK